MFSIQITCLSCRCTANTLPYTYEPELEHISHSSFHKAAGRKQQKCLSFFRQRRYFLRDALRRAEKQAPRARQSVEQRKNMAVPRRSEKIMQNHRLRRAE